MPDVRGHWCRVGAADSLCKGTNAKANPSCTKGCTQLNGGWHYAVQL
jgi:hypothetical protein